MKKKKPYFLKLNSGIFSFDILFTVGTTEDEVVNYLDKKCGMSLSDDEIKRLDLTDKSGRTIQFENRSVLIWLHNDYLPVLIHELFHATEFILDTVGIKLTPESDEVYAYFMEHLMRQICEDKGNRAYFFKK